MSYHTLSKMKNTPAKNVCSISLNKNNRIRLIGLPVDELDSVKFAMRYAITNSWGAIAEEGYDRDMYEFKLSGNPWMGDGGKYAVYSRRLLAAMLTTMAQLGWNLLQAAGITKKLYSIDTLFFEKGTPDPDVALFAMSFNMSDRIRIIDAPSFAVCIADAIKSQWHKGIQNKRDYYGSIEFKLSGNPWHPSGSEATFGGMLLCQIIANMRAKEYKLYGCIDISTGEKDSSIGIEVDIEEPVDSWIFRRVGPYWS